MVITLKEFEKKCKQVWPETNLIAGKEFIEFLAKNNAELQFFYYLTKNGKGYDYIASTASIESPLSKAFAWHNTKEGRNYWSDLSYKWHDYMLIRQMEKWRIDGK